ncbi:fluoride efflux transporter FluC [Peribacillus sp. SCS-37]|uniref:fluoride efflux transporter FluC n=1 Tax=Paraperibacillus esterisolvens TaxID=3115296 RepID=UPI0039059BFF
MLKSIAAAGFGGAAGAMARFWLQQGAAGPAGTLTANILASLLIGYLNGLQIKEKKPVLLIFLGTGFCGGFSTMSTFSKEVCSLLFDGGLSGLLYIVSTAVLCIGSALLGYSAAGKAVN